MEPMTMPVVYVDAVPGWNFKKSKLKKQLPFIAFSGGEEKGLWGSNYFVNHLPLPIANMNYMINMDMVGRDQDRQLAL